MKAILLVLLLGTIAFSLPSGFFSSQDKETTIKTITSSQKNDGTFGSTLKSTYYSVSTLSQLGATIPNKDKICTAVKGKGTDAESIFYESYITESLGCGATVSASSKDVLQTALKSSKANDVAFALLAIHSLEQNKHSSVSDVDRDSAVKKLIGLADDEGLIGGNVYSTGLSLQALAHYTKVDKSGISTILTNAAGLVSQAEGDDYLEFEKTKDVSSLKVTSTYLNGLTQLASALDKKQVLKNEELAQLTETFILHKNSYGAEDISAVVEGLNAAKLAVPSPLVISIAQSSISASATGKDANVRVRVTDVFGNFAAKSKVTLVNAKDSSKKSVLSNQELSATIADPSAFELVNFLSGKPDAGFYSIELKATPEGSAYAEAKQTVLPLKVVSEVVVSNVEVTVSESLDNQDLLAGKKFKAEFPKTVSGKIPAEGFQFLTTSFKLKNQVSGKNILPHQVFVHLSDIDSEVVEPAEYDGEKYVASISLEEVSTPLRSESGDYTLTITVGDPHISNSVAYKAATVTIKYANVTKVNVDVPFAPKPEIVHKFRTSEKRPATTTSFAFTLATLAPALFLLIGWTAVGANLRNFPTGTGFIYAIGFEATLGAILALFILYWLRLTMIETLTYLTILFVPFLFFSQKCLNYLALQNSKVKTN